MPSNIISHREEVEEAFNDAVIRALTKCGLTAETKAKQKITEVRAVDTGNLRNSITNKVVESEKAVYIGTNVEYGAFIELGTGIYAKGGGRPTPWAYQDEKGNWHRTSGQEPRPFLKPAIADNAQIYKNIIDDEMRGG